MSFHGRETSIRVSPSYLLQSLILPILLIASFCPTHISSASFPLTAISHYTELAPCAVSHLEQDLNTWPYDGCTSANTPISAYGSCICAQRLHSIQAEISLDFGADPECSTTSVQPYLTAFCEKWGVDIGAVDRASASTTTTLAAGGGNGAGRVILDQFLWREWTS